MAMALNRKYSALPDLDTAPDIYETPELTDDNSTVLTTTGRLSTSNSDDSEGGDSDNSDEYETGISRSHLHVDQARSRFSGSTVDARRVDFSDRVDGKRKSYRTTTSERRRQRRQREADARLGDVSEDGGSGKSANGDGDGDDDEDSDSPTGLERKIARLKREVEETRAAYNKRQAKAAAADTKDDNTAEKVTVGLDSLSRALESISRLADDEAERNVARFVAATESGSSEETEATPVLPAPTSASTAASTTVSLRVPPSASLAQAADFDRRLMLLERSIGIGSSVLLPELNASGTASASASGGAALPRAILPTIDNLHRQIVTLAEASTASLDGISRRVRTLTQEADQLAKARQAAKSAQDALAEAGVVTGTATKGKDGAAGEGSEDDAKINALYGMLPTIESLTPLLPPLLDRLRSLRTIHADAAAAGELLDDLAQQQADTAAEVKQWRQGLDKIEAALRDGEATMGRNAQVMEGWVKGLEARLDKVA